MTWRLMARRRVRRQVVGGVAMVATLVVGPVAPLRAVAVAVAQDPVSVRVDEIRDQMRAGRWGDALQTLDVLARDHPDRQKAFVGLLRIRCLLRTGRTREAGAMVSQIEALARDKSERHLLDDLDVEREIASRVLDRVHAIRNAAGVAAVDHLVGESDDREPGVIDLLRARAGALYRLGAYQASAERWEYLLAVGKRGSMPWLVSEAEAGARRARRAANGLETLEALHAKAERDPARALEHWEDAVARKPDLNLWATAQIFVSRQRVAVGQPQRAFDDLKALAREPGFSAADKARLLIEAGAIAEDGLSPVQARTAYEDAKARAGEARDVDLESDAESRRLAVSKRIGTVRLVCPVGGEPGAAPVDVSVMRGSFTGVGGSLECGGAELDVPAGRLDFRLDAGELVTTQEVEVEPGRTTDIEVGTARSYGSTPWILAGGAALAAGAAVFAYARFDDVRAERDALASEVRRTYRSQVAAGGDPLEVVPEDVFAKDDDLYDEQRGYQVAGYGLLAVSVILATTAVSLRLMETDGLSIEVAPGGVGLSGSF